MKTDYKSLTTTDKKVTKKKLLTAEKYFHIFLSILIFSLLLGPFLEDFVGYKKLPSLIWQSFFFGGIFLFGLSGIITGLIVIQAEVWRHIYQGKKAKTIGLAIIILDLLMLLLFKAELVK